MAEAEALVAAGVAAPDVARENAQTVVLVDPAQ
mgnify:CR=1 FL=1